MLAEGSVCFQRFRQCVPKGPRSECVVFAQAATYLITDHSPAFTTRQGNGAKSANVVYSTADNHPFQIAMKRFLSIALAAIGAWVLVSFAGTMLDTVRADFWTQSLMWSLLTTLVLGPLMILATMRSSKPEPSIDEPVAASNEKAPALIEDETNRMRTLWPNDEQTKEEKETA